MTNVDRKVEDKEVRNLVDRLTALPQKTTEWLKSVAAPRMRESFKKNFEEEGRPNKWKPLSGGTQQIRRMGRELGWWSVGDSSPILQRTGELMKMVISTEEEIREENGEMIMAMNPQKMASQFAGSKRGGANSYLEHQMGMGASKISGEPGVAKRQMVLFQNEDIQWLSNRYDDFINNIIQK